MYYCVTNLLHKIRDLFSGLAGAKSHVQSFDTLSSMCVVFIISHLYIFQDLNNGSNHVDAIVDVPYMLISSYRFLMSDTTPCPGKKSIQYSLNNFHKCERIFAIFRCRCRLSLDLTLGVQFIIQFSIIMCLNRSRL